jgi:flagellar biosynthesis chaperone FliJ
MTTLGLGRLGMTLYLNHMAKDPLVTLQKLRRLEAQAKRRALAERLAAEEAARQALAAAEQALRQESSEGLNPQLGAFIQKALDYRATAEEKQERARQETDRQRQILADARAAERVVEQLRENRADEAARQEARREQNRMDEAARKPS